MLAAVAAASALTSSPRTKSANGAKNFRRLLKQDLRHPIERVGEKLRARMPWLQGAR